jgi:type IV pilus assembly protein PilP
MMRRTVIFFCLFLLAGCAEEPVTSAPPKTNQKVRPAATNPQQEEIVPEKAVEKFAYSPIGKRDPFESLLRKEEQARKSQVPLTPLEKFDLGQFRMIALLIGKGEPRAMVSAPDGKNYILKPGLKIGKNDGVIVDITSSGVIVEEQTFDLAGKLLKSRQTISMPQKKTL